MRSCRGKTLDELTIGEAALLAGVIANPEGTNPFAYPSRAWKRRADVLQARSRSGLHHAGRGRRGEERAAAHRGCRRTSCGRATSSSPRCRTACSTTRGSGSTPKERRDTLLKGGLKIYTTFDKRLQDLADDATAQRVAEQPGRARLGVVARRDRPVDRCGEGDGQTARLRRQPVQHRDPPVGRQPGSTWKVITLAAALAERLLAERHRRRQRSRARCRSSSATPPRSTRATARAGPTDLWAATAGFGELRVRPALDERGPGQGDGDGPQDGHHASSACSPHLTLSIGDIEATPLEMATVMATIANDGVHQAPYFVQTGRRARRRSRSSGSTENRPAAATGCSTRTSPSASRSCCAA